MSERHSPEKAKSEQKKKNPTKFHIFDVKVPGREGLPVCGVVAVVPWACCLPRSKAESERELVARAHSCA